MKSDRVLDKEGGLPPLDQLGFGQFYSPFMCVQRYADGAWQELQTVDYQVLEMDPASQVLHYGQAIFEGMKAYHNADQGKYFLFRPEQNGQRYARSAKRLCMPDLPVELFVQSVEAAVRVAKPWIPPYTKSNPTAASLYIRPFQVGTTPKLGVKPATEYAHVVITSPSGPYFATGLKPIRLKVEEHYVRAAPGGTGEAKAAGNYAASLLAAEIAQRQGYAQVLWLDATETKYIEEVGAMNVFVVRDGVLLAPKLDGSILPGITRQSMMVAAASELGMEVKETHIAIAELIDGIKSGVVSEVFGSGTAAVITPVGVLGYKGTDYRVNHEEVGPVAQKLYDTLVAIQYGEYSPNWAKGWAREIVL